MLQTKTQEVDCWSISNEIGDALKDIAQLELVDFKNKQYVEGIMEAEKKRRSLWLLLI